MKKYISPHSIALYNKCPRMFYYYIHEYKSLPPPEYYKPPLEFGTLIHKIIAKYYELIPDTLVPTEILIHLKKAFNELWNVKYEPFRERVEKQLMNFVKFEKQRLSWHFNAKPVAVEKEFVKGRVHGIVDALFRKGDDLVVVDWKTGYVTAAYNDDINVQLNVYMWLTGAKEAYVVYLEYGYWEKIEKINIEEIIKMILSDNTYAPLRGPQCDTCPYQFICMTKDPFNYSVYGEEI